MSSPHTNTVDDIALFLLVTETLSFVWLGRASDANHSKKLPILLATNLKKELHDIELFLPP